MSDASPRGVVSGDAPRTAVRSWVAPAVGTIVGAIYAFNARSYDTGTLVEPGPGLVPFTVGALLAMLCAGLTVGAVRANLGPTRDLTHDVATHPPPHKSNSRLGFTLTVVLTAGICAGIIWQSRIIGMVPAAAVAAAAVAWLMRCKVLTALLVGLGFFVFTQVVFVMLLEVPLPRGYL